MAEYVAGKGTTALGILGTVLGSIGTAGVLGNGVNLFNTPRSVQSYYEGESVCKGDLQLLMEKDAEIAKLNSEKYADKNGIELYKYIDSELKDIRATIGVNKEQANAQFAQQAVYNATANGTMSTIANQVTNLQTVVGQITKTAVPASAICNFGCNCCTSVL